MLSSKSRFSLLLLDENEVYFDDFSANLYLVLNDERKVKGRLKVCSHSLMFDPDDVRLPILKFQFRCVERLEQQQQQSPLRTSSSFSPSSSSSSSSSAAPASPAATRPFALFSSLTASITSSSPAGGSSGKVDYVLLTTTLTVEMKENNVNAPYVFKQDTLSYRFSLNYVNLASFLPRVRNLWSISKLPPEQGERQLQGVIDEHQSSLAFNTSQIEDIGEKILAELTGERITPLAHNPGRVLITNAIIYFQPFNNISANPVDKFRLSSVVRIAKRRCVLRHVGIELFFESTQRDSEAESVLFAFKSADERDRIYDLLLKQPACTKLIIGDESNMCLKWQNGLVSNFDYLMYLNSLAGRTFNDVEQYPVFPWVVADYSSSFLDLQDPRSFRDLSKPVGALNPDRIRTLRQRMAEMPEPKFLYGTHYSTPGYVVFYLVRSAPDWMLRLQNGRFDAPSRMFHSIQETWHGVMSNPADVKELIPEFYQPGRRGFFLLNSERLYLGTKENGVRLDDVVLPPWARDAEDFVNKLRLALESEFVSERLHNWIDLIFGHKQKGPAAIDADNLFYPLTYEGAVDIDAITDPFEKSAVIAQIKEFGQTPRQLFTRPHAQRFPMASRAKTGRTVGGPAQASADLFEQDNLPSLKAISTLGTSLGVLGGGLEFFPGASPGTSPASFLPVNSPAEPPMVLPGVPSSLIDALSATSLKSSGGSVSSVDSGGGGGGGEGGLAPAWPDLADANVEFTARPHKDVVTKVCVSPDGALLYSTSQDASLKVFSLREKKQLRSVSLGELALSDVQVSSDGRFLVVASWDNSIYLYSQDSGRVQCSVLAHDDAVSCLQVRLQTIVSGSWDASVKVWRLRGAMIDTSPTHEFFAHDAGVSALALRDDATLVASGDQQGHLVLFDLRTTKALWTLRPFSGACSGIQFLPTDGRRLVACSESGEFKLLDTRGDTILSASINDRIRCLCTDGCQLLLGGSALHLWSLAIGAAVKSFALPTASEDITSIAGPCALPAVISVGFSKGTLKLLSMP